MTSSKVSLSGLRILIVNDDSIHSNGIKALERIANSITPDVWIVAPDTGQSGKAFSVTFDSPLRVKEHSPRKFAVTGTPADCVFVALGEILKDKKPDLVLSGINHGSNIADFIGLSGTVGATFAAASQGIKSIAVSQDCIMGSSISKFPIADHYFPKIIKKLLSFQWPDGVCMNVNFPDTQVGNISGVKIVRQGGLDINWSVHKRLDPVDVPYYWLRAIHTNKNLHKNDDVTVLEEKSYITITPLICNQEYRDCMKELEELFISNV